MKRISLAAISVLVALVATVALGATTSTAAVLCKSSSEICPAGSDYPAGTEISASLVPKTSIVVTEASGKVFSYCESANYAVKVSDPGGDSKFVTTEEVKTAHAEVGSCQSQYHVPTAVGGAGGKIYTLEGAHIADELTFTWNVLGTICSYKLPLKKSNLSTGSNPKWSINGEMRPVTEKWPCPEGLRMSAEFEIKTPKPLYVALRRPYPTFCKVLEATCAPSNEYLAGTKTSASLYPGWTFNLQEPPLPEGEGEILVQCKSSSMEGEITKTGGEEISADVTGLSVGNCTAPVHIEGLPWHAVVDPLSVESLASETVNGLTVSVTTSFYGTCVYGGNPAFEIEGGSPAFMAVEHASLPVQKGSTSLCPPRVKLTTAYSITSPNPLYVTKQ